MVYYLSPTAILLLLLFMIVKIKSDCPQSSFTSAEIRICAEKCIYQTVQRCVDSDSFIGKVKEVSFINTKVPNFRRAIFNNMIDLKSINAGTMGLKRFYPDAFHNTPNLENVDFIFNYVEEIPWGVFNNKPKLERIILSRNSINYIEEEAFSNLPNLKVIILMRNQLKEYNKEWFKGSTSLETLNLSNNQITKLWFGSFDIFPNLMFLDLSFNKILDIGANSFKNVKHLKMLDLTSNNLTAISVGIFPDNLVIKQLRIPLNRISFLSEEVLKRGSVESIALNPNPWQCPCLDKINKWAKKNSMVILEPNEDYRINLNNNLPVCAFKEKNPEVCVLAYDEEFLSTQEEYFKEVIYTNAVREKPTSEPPNFDVLHVDHSRDNLSPL